MKLFAQHGYGPGDKIINGFKDNTIDGVIFSARYEKMEKIPGDAKNINSVSSDAEILLDPEFYACFYAHQPDAKLGGLNEWPYFSTQRRSQLESSEIVEKVLADTFDTVVDLPLTSQIFLYQDHSIPLKRLLLKTLLEKLNNYLRKQAINATYLQH
jgi:hypothetical protein